jgi:hypothetical protein
LRRRVVVVAAAAVRLGGGMYAGTGWRRSGGFGLGWQPRPRGWVRAWVGGGLASRACAGRARRRETRGFRWFFGVFFIGVLRVWRGGDHEGSVSGGL